MTIPVDMEVSREVCLPLADTLFPLCASHSILRFFFCKAHVAGSIAGRRSANGRDEQTGDADGVATGAKLAFFDIGEADNGLKVPLLSTMFATGYQDAGARVHSASWGSPNLNSYSSFDHQADSFMSVQTRDSIVLAICS